jgi:RHS repeat-associated protein
LGNGLGSTEALTDEDGDVTATYKYDVFGAVRSSSGAGWTEYRFTGQQDDAELGYTYLRARYYDPQTGRFVSKDPVSGLRANPASQHYYVYAGDDPANLTDPSGEFLDTILDLAFIAYDLYRIGTDNVVGTQDNLGDNLVALGADTAGAFVPFATGLGLAARVGKTANCAREGERLLPSAGIDEVAKGIADWLGPDVIVSTNKAGDRILTSVDGLRKFRADIINPGGHTRGPHAHLEIYNGTRWQPYGKKKIYPWDVP